MVLLSQFALESVFAHSTTIELAHDKAVFLNEIKDGLIFVRNTLEPFMLVNVALDNVDLRVQDIMEMFAFVEHRQIVSVFIKSIAFLDAYGNRLGIAGFLVPFAFVYQPALLLSGSSLSIALGFAVAAVGVLFLAGGVIGHLAGPLSLLQRCLLLAAACFLVFPSVTRAILGLIVGFLVFFWSYHQNRVSHPQGPVLTP